MTTTIDFSFDDTGVVRAYSTGHRDVMPWDNVALVALVWYEKFDRGPFSERGYWDLHAIDGLNISIPFSTAKRKHLLEHVARLPDFPVESTAHALRDREPRYLTVWQRPTWRCRACGQADMVRQEQTDPMPWAALLVCPACHTTVHIGNRRSLP